MEQTHSESTTTVRIGTWNVEYASAARNSQRLSLLLPANADIWVLTETQDGELLDVWVADGFLPPFRLRRAEHLFLSNELWSVWFPPQPANVQASSVRGGRIEFA